MKKFLYIILGIMVAGVLAGLYLVEGKKEGVMVEEGGQVGTTTDREVIKPKSDYPTVVFGDAACEVVSGKKFAKLPITLSESGWSYGETLVKPKDTNIASNSGKTFENVDLSRPFYEIASEDWGESVVTVKLWKDKNENPLVTTSKTISAQAVCNNK